MLDYTIKIGLVPEHRYLPGTKRTGMFNSDDDMAVKDKAFEFLCKNVAEKACSSKPTEPGSRHAVRPVFDFQATPTVQCLVFAHREP